MNWPLIALLDDVLLQVQTSSLQKILFWGDGAGGISSYVAGWMAGKEIDVILLDGANCFNPYMVSSFARSVLIPPERLLRKIRIARAFTCYQMATLMGERLVSLVGGSHACTSGCGLPSAERSVQAGVSARRHESPLQKPWVIVLGPISTFLDEDVPERKVRPLFERALRKVREMTMAGIPFFLFQPSVFSGNHSPFIKRGRGELMNSRRTYLTKSLFQFSDLVWKIEMEDEGPKLILEKGVTEKYPNNRHQIPNKRPCLPQAGMGKILHSKPPSPRPLPTGRGEG